MHVVLGRKKFPKRHNNNIFIQSDAHKSGKKDCCVEYIHRNIDNRKNVREPLK